MTMARADHSCSCTRTQLQPVRGALDGVGAQAGQTGILQFPLDRGSEAEAAFPQTEGDLERLKGIVFAIVLDADTELPPGIRPRVWSGCSRTL